MLRRSLVACAALSAALLSAPGLAQTVGQSAPALALKDSAGKLVNLADFRGKTVVLDQEQYTAYRSDADPKVRAQVFKAFWPVYKAYERTLGAVYAATHDGASNQGIQGYIQLSVLLVAGVLGQQAEALPLPAVLGDDGHIPKPLDALPNRLSVVGVGVANFAGKSNAAPIWPAQQAS